MQNLINLGSGAGKLKPTTRPSALPINQKFLVLAAKRVKTPYGNAILVELEKEKIFLPSRFSEMMEEDLSYLNNGKVQLSYSGRVNGMDLIDFSTTEDLVV